MKYRTYHFTKESELQDWLSSAIQGTDDFQSLIINKPSDLSCKSNYINKKILSSIEYCYDAASMLISISENKDISEDRSEKLKPDFIAYNPEYQCLVILEIKSKHPTNCIFLISNQHLILPKIKNYGKIFKRAEDRDPSAATRGGKYKKFCKASWNKRSVNLQLAKS